MTSTLENENRTAAPLVRLTNAGKKRKKGLRLDIPFMRKTCEEEMLAMGIDLRDVEQA